MVRRSRRLCDLGETALIERIAKRVGGAIPGRWVVGIGDDAAILRGRSGEDLVFSTDTLVEDVHFRIAREGPNRIGRRALAVNLSDLAAMGATPVGVLLSICAPPELPVAVFDGFVAGFVDDAKRHACPLVGGNLSRAEKCILSVTVIGRVARGRALRRTGLAVGDLLFVTGVLGRGALARLEADRLGRPLRHVPEPRLEAGRRLARMPGVKACIDLSDGLASDLAQLLRPVGLGAEVDPAALPADRGFSRACSRSGIDPLVLQATGGEDYELLFALAPGRAAADPVRLGRRLGVRVSRIGRVVAGQGIAGLPTPSAGHHF
ncbi:MAG: thiamine-phosphate kinase [Myxococcota bacterium]